MENYSFDSGIIPATVNYSRFRGSSGVEEFHIMVRPTTYEAADVQLGWVEEAYEALLASLDLDTGSVLWRRFFCSDLPNQVHVLENRPFSNPRNTSEPCAVSWVCQPPVPPVKVALWAYHVRDPRVALQKVQEGTTVTLQRGELAHRWTTGLTCLSADSSYDQTMGVFGQYIRQLEARDLSLADNVIRTWLFVQNVDANYQGLVEARKGLFEEHGLTVDTHYLASTGIEGTHADVSGKVTMDAYAIGGVTPGQIEYLEALDHLSATHVYGVTFERATSVAYSDRKHIIISGTASIDHHGHILHVGDVSKQLDRTLENIGALLAQAGASLDDMCMFIVYVRDPSDHELAWRTMRERFGDAPVEVVVAPVCRPGWLIEVEGKAICPISDPSMPEF